ncbi:MAG TPA: PIN domain-containing protein [Paracoccaceae bacterium]|nr:PIN domain-containing protein [Paracoccaceae bacterium]HMO72366.1 PIN domain-containing protein [Paracoccaceae bacterium]
MRAVLDACVLVPPVVRDCLLSAAAAGAYRPFWSDRILGEWAHAAARHGRDDGPVIAAAQAQFPAARVPPAPGVEARLHLPDAGDVHVLATAVAGSADTIVTWNAADFPRGALAAEGVARRDPDGFLWELWSLDPEGVSAALERVRARAEAMAGTPVALGPLLKRARLTRLARAVAV